MKTKIKTIDLEAKEYRTGGNSYFSCLITLNYGLKDQAFYTLPVQYGYGDHYEDEAFKFLKKNINKKCLKGLRETLGFNVWCSDNKIILRSIIHKNCDKKTVINWGEK